MKTSRGTAANSSVMAAARSGSSPGSNMRCVAVTARRRDPQGIMRRQVRTSARHGAAAAVVVVVAVARAPIGRSVLLKPNEDADGLDDSVTWRGAERRAHKVELVSRRDTFVGPDHLRRGVWRWVHDGVGRDDDQVWRQVVAFRAASCVHGELIRTVNSVDHDVVARVDGCSRDGGTKGRAGRTALARCCSGRHTVPVFRFLRGALTAAAHHCPGQGRSNDGEEGDRDHYTGWPAFSLTHECMMPARERLREWACSVAPSSITAG